MKQIIIVAATLLALASTGLAQEHGGEAKGAHPKAGPEAGLKKAGLTDAQIEQVKALHLELQSEQIDRQATAKKAQLKLDALMTDEKAKAEDLLAAFDANAKAHVALKRLELEGLTKARALLGRELADKLHAMHGKGKGKGHPGMGKGHPGMGKGHPGCEGHPGCKGHPGMGKGHPGMGKGHPGMGKGHPGCAGHPGCKGHPGMGKGHPGMGKGHPGCEGHPGCKGHPGMGKGHPGCKGHPGMGKGHPGCKGHPGMGHPSMGECCPGSGHGMRGRSGNRGHRGARRGGLFGILRSLLRRGRGGDRSWGRGGEHGRWGHGGEHGDWGRGSARPEHGKRKGPTSRPHGRHHDGAFGHGDSGTFF